MSSTVQILPIIIQFDKCLYFGNFSGLKNVLNSNLELAAQKTQNYYYIKIVSDDFDQIFFKDGI